MKIKQIFPILLMTILLLGFSGCEDPQEEYDGVPITIGAKRNLSSMVPEEMAGQTITWESSAPNVASVTNDGIVTALRFTGNGDTRFSRGSATGTAIITATAGGLTHEITVTTTTSGTENIMDLPPLKDQFAEYFLIGNIFNPGDASGSARVNNERLTRHFNVLTHENHMKPDQISSSPSTAERMLNAARASGFEVVGHTLLWHSQIPSWQRNMASSSRETALTSMRDYISNTVGRFAGKIHTWDVLNEVFPDGGYSASSDWRQVMRSGNNGNPWYMAIGSDFVYEGFLAARQADPNATLYYNDYNTDQLGKATMIHDMVRDVNARYKQEFPNETRLLIEGIGMQEHHNTGVQVSNIRRTLALFKPLGVKISVSELDVLGQGWGQFSPIGSGTNKQGQSTVTNDGIMTQARLYREYMELYLEYSDIIERVTWWGVTDNLSWRSGGLPLLFDPRGRAKPAYYSVIQALENHKQKTDGS